MQRAASCTRRSCCGCSPSSSSSCPRSATSTSRSWCSSSTRRTCCSTTRPTRCVDKIEQVVRLIRSKGVGVYFVTQNPIDIPEEVLGQLGNRVQHALRAFTPRDQKAVRAAAETFRANPGVDVETVITELGVGEALVSFLDEKGMPSVGRARVRLSAGEPRRRRSPPTSARAWCRARRCAASTSARSIASPRTSGCVIARRARRRPLALHPLATWHRGRRARVPACRRRDRAARRSRRGIGEAMMKSAARSASTVIAREGAKLSTKLVRGHPGLFVRREVGGSSVVVVHRPELREIDLELGERTRARSRSSSAWCSAGSSVLPEERRKRSSVRFVGSTIQYSGVPIDAYQPSLTTRSQRCCSAR